LDYLPEALAVIERGVGTESELLGCVEVLSVLADVAICEAAGLGVSTFRAFSDVGAALSPIEDAPMISHIRGGLASGSLHHALSARSVPTPGLSVPDRDIPMEDRGRTHPFVKGVGGPVAARGEAIVVGGDVGPEVPAPPHGGPPAPQAMQWLPVAIWAIRMIGKLNARIRYSRATVARASGV
jgi:hypothetical protein